MSIYTDKTNLTSPVFLYEQATYPIVGNSCVWWAETYRQLRANHVRQALNTGSTRHGGAFLIEESPLVGVGHPNSPIVEFTRTYSTLPATHTEKLLYAYTYPGLSGGAGADWDPYGSRKPITAQVVATDTYEYSLGAPTLQAWDRATVPYFTVSGERFACDFIGAIYDEAPPYNYAGTTTPSAEPSEYIVAIEIERFAGNIFRKTTRTVPKLTWST